MAITYSITHPLNKLIVSDDNPRGTPTQNEIVTLAASIKSVGLLQPLLISTNGEAYAGRLPVLGGGRRLRALNYLAKTGDLPNDWAVPVVAYDDDASARLAAVVENAARAPLSPLEEMRAYAAQIEHGSTIEDVAAAFAVAERYVTQRIALSRLPDEVLAHIESGGCTLTVAQTLTMAPSKDVALDLWMKHGSNVHMIRKELGAAAANYQMNNDLRMMGGAEAYAELGGKVSVDLFSDDVVVLDDAETFKRIVGEFLSGEAGKVATAAGFSEWIWTEALDRETATRLYPDVIDMRTVEDVAEADALEEKYEGDYPEGPDFDRAVALEVLSETESWSADVLEHGFALVRRGWGDALLVVDGAGIGKHKGVELGILEEGIKNASGDAPAPADKGPSNPLADAAQALKDDTARLPSDIARALVFSKPAIALDLMCWQLSLPGYTRGTTISGQPAAVSNLVGVPTREQCLPGAALTFLEFQALPKAKRLAFLGEWFAEHLTSGSTGADAALSACKTSIRKQWTPDAVYLGRMKKPQLLHVYLECTGLEWLGMANMKKGGLVDGLAKLFAGSAAPAYRAGFDAWLPYELRGKGWLPAVPPGGAEEPTAEAA